MSRIHGLFLSLEFPNGIAPGESGDYNVLTVARNGRGKPVLRGTALAGSLRHAYRRGTDSEERTAKFFGYRLGDDDDSGGAESNLKVGDCELIAGPSISTRTHHLRDRHTGTVVDGGLFSLESCPPGTKTSVALWLSDEADSVNEATEFLRTILGILNSGLTLGGNAARGIGNVQLIGDAKHRVYELTKVDEYAQWLDDYRQWRQAPENLPEGEPIFPASDTERSTLEVSISLAIPRGQDLLVGDGQGLDHEIEPQRVVGADGNEYWRLPGSTLRGMFRGWFSRLAARDGKNVADSVERHQRRARAKQNGERIPEHEQMNGNNLGWRFQSEEDRKDDNQPRPDCVVSDLFGSLFEAGRIHISDGYAPCSQPDDNRRYAEEQLRMHVAVDRITGGAAESMLFENTVLTAYSDGRSPAFDVSIRVENPTDNEVAWLAKTIRALDLGILRVGSSKSAGRLSLVKSPLATGPGAEQLNSIEPYFGPNMFGHLPN